MYSNALVELGDARIARAIRHENIPGGVPGHVGRPIEIIARSARAGAARRTTSTAFPAAFAARNASCISSEGGSIQDNIDRWEGQFKTPGGKPAPAKVTKITIHGLAVTTIDVSGEYSGMAGPAATAPVRVLGYRLLGAIVESPGGNVFIKFTGSAKTMAANQPKFQQLLDSFEKAGK